MPDHKNKIPFNPFTSISLVVEIPKPLASGLSLVELPDKANCIASMSFAGLNLIDDSSSVISVLNILDFIVDGDYKYFILKDLLGDTEIRVPFVPNYVSERDVDRYDDCILFENPYLTAENDVFEVFENSLAGRLGWIFPITSLDSNENNFANNDSFKHYRHIAYQKLLTSDFDVRYQESKQEYRISEIFNGLSICILCKDEISKLQEFRIENYALSFLKFDYLIYSNFIKGKKIFNKTKEIEDLRKEKHIIRVKKSSFDIAANQYTKSLFLEHLYQTDNLLTKYILLYQILEHFIQEFSDKFLNELIEKYQNKKITKNKFRDKIGKSQSELFLIRKAFENSKIGNEVKEWFIEKCSRLFSELNLEIDDKFEDVLYDLRNLITHNYRAITNKSDHLNEIVYLFEKIIIDLLITFNQKQNDVKVMQIEVSA